MNIHLNYEKKYLKYKKKYLVLQSGGSDSYNIDSVFNGYLSQLDEDILSYKRLVTVPINSIKALFNPEQSSNNIKNNSIKISYHKTILFFEKEMHKIEYTTEIPDYIKYSNYIKYYDETKSKKKNLLITINDDDKTMIDKFIKWFKISIDILPGSLETVLNSKSFSTIFSNYIYEFLESNNLLKNEIIKNKIRESYFFKTMDSFNNYDIMYTFYMRKLSNLDVQPVQFT
jgi:hypothetical protein